VTRAEKRERAAGRRRDWQLGWLEVLKDGADRGLAMRQALVSCAELVVRQIRDSPGEKDEILRVWLEFNRELATLAKNKNDNRTSENG
jgi:hypothetical protein